MKRTKVLMVLMSLSLMIAGCGTMGRKTPIRKSDRHITILAVNDIHAAIDNFPRFGYIIDSLRMVYPHLLLVSGGDNQTGNPVNDQYPEKGLPMVDLMNAVKFDISAVGNHEFDSGLEGFASLSHKAHFPLLCANLTIPKGSHFKIKPYHIITTGDGVRVAVVSLLHINSTGIPDSHPNNVKGFVFHDPFEVGKQYQHLKDSADVLIYLNHFGIENDVELAKLLDPKSTPLIIGGHSHTKIDKEMIENDILITQAASKLKFATLIHLTIKPNGDIERKMTLLPVGKEGNFRPDLKEMVDRYNSAPALKQVVARAEDDFTNYEQLGYLTVDALRIGTGTQMALINPGGVRIDKLPKGDISVMDVYSLDPFGNEAIELHLTGQELLNLHYVAFELDNRIPLYPSGFRSEYTLNKDGSLKEVRLFNTDGTPLDLNKTYSISMNNYITAAYKYEHKDPGKSLFVTTADNMITYLKNIKVVPSYKNEKRVIIHQER